MSQATGQTNRGVREESQRIFSTQGPGAPAVDVAFQTEARESLMEGAETTSLLGNRSFFAQPGIFRPTHRDQQAD